MRYFELIDDKSSKFWEIYNSWNTEPQYIETRFGKIGSDGRVSKIVYHTLKEGTDMVMVQPGMIYLDIIKQIKNNFKVPVLAYQVSGEYFLIKNAIQKKILKDDSIIESLIAFKRAGACAIVTYFAIDIAKKIKNI